MNYDIWIKMDFMIIIRTKELKCGNHVLNYITFFIQRWPLRFKSNANTTNVKISLICNNANIFIFLVMLLLRIIWWPSHIDNWAATRQNQQNECAPSEDSDQPGHPPSLIRFFAVRMKKAWVLSYPLSASEDSDQTGWMARLIWVFAGRTLTLLVLSCRGSIHYVTIMLQLDAIMFDFILSYFISFLDVNTKPLRYIQWHRINKFENKLSHFMSFRTYCILSA